MHTQFLTDQCFVLQSRKWANTKEVVDKGVILQLDFMSRLILQWKLLFIHKFPNYPVEYNQDIAS